MPSAHAVRLCANTRVADETTDEKKQETQDTNNRPKPSGRRAQQFLLLQAPWLSSRRTAQYWASPSLLTDSAPSDLQRMARPLWDEAVHVSQGRHHCERRPFRAVAGAPSHVPGRGGGCSFSFFWCHRSFVPRAKTQGTNSARASPQGYRGPSQLGFL